MSWWRWAAPLAATAGLTLTVYIVLRPVGVPKDLALRDTATLAQPPGQDSTATQPSAPAPTAVEPPPAPPASRREDAAPAERADSKRADDARAKLRKLERAQPVPAPSGRAEPQRPANEVLAETDANVAAPLAQQSNVTARRDVAQAPVATEMAAGAPAPPPSPATAPPARAAPAGASAEAFGERQRPAKSASVAEGLSLDEARTQRVAAVPDAVVRWRVGRGGLIERSVDAGASWIRQSSGVTADLLAASAPAELVCWAVGREGTVLVTTDGTTWTRVGPPSRVDLVRVHARDARSATVTTRDGSRFTTTDGGLRWASLP